MPRQRREEGERPEKAAKKVNYSLIDRYEVGSLKFSEPYQLLGELIAAHHRHLAEGVVVVLAWRHEVKPSKDGKLELGKARKVNDLDRQRVDGDFIILLNKDAWGAFLPNQRRALLDHELCHCVVELDKAGNPKEDETGKPLTRMRRHDLEEFVEVVERHGCYLKDLEEMADAMLHQSERGRHDA